MVHGLVDPRLHRLAEYLARMFQVFQLAECDHLHDGVAEGRGFHRARYDGATDGVRRQLAQQRILASSPDDV